MKTTDLRHKPGGILYKRSQCVSCDDRHNLATITKVLRFFVHWLRIFASVYVSINTGTITPGKNPICLDEAKMAAPIINAFFQKDRIEI